MNNQIYAMQFCDNVRFLRKKSGFSKRKMAGCLGIGVYSLQKIEKNIIPPRLVWTVILRIQAQFHIPPYKIFSPLDEME